MCDRICTVLLLARVQVKMGKSKSIQIDNYVIGKVKEMRIKHKISQAELARLMDVSEGFIGNIESPNYRAKYNIKHLNDLAIIFNCSPKDFLPEKPLS
jgi:transcriptional regulator with XRE-family HTH domain